MQKTILVYAHWYTMEHPVQIGKLSVSYIRGKEVFSFEYNTQWLKGNNGFIFDPDLQYFSGPQYPRPEKTNFGVFLDSSPDRWGRVLLKRREVLNAYLEKRTQRKLQESDFLLGVFDGNRIGALRFKKEPDGDFLDNNERCQYPRVNPGPRPLFAAYSAAEPRGIDTFRSLHSLGNGTNKLSRSTHSFENKDFASPPWIAVRDLEYASLQIEKNKSEKSSDYKRWLDLLIAPGSSLGGARPKAGIIDENNNLWIAKFPKGDDSRDIGAWEIIVHELAVKAGINVPECKAEKFSSPHHTFLTKRFDRMPNNERLHFASAMTMLGYTDGNNASSGVSYLELAEFIVKHGSNTTQDLKELWKRIVFSICVIMDLYSTGQGGGFPLPLT